MAIKHTIIMVQNMFGFIVIKMTRKNISALSIYCLFGGVCWLIPNATATVLNHVSCKSIKKILSVNVHRAQEGFIFIKNILQGSNNLFLYVATGFRNKLEPLIVLINKLFKGFVQI